MIRLHVRFTDSSKETCKIRPIDASLASYRLVPDYDLFLRAARLRGLGYEAKPVSSLHERKNLMHNTRKDCWYILIKIAAMIITSIYMSTSYI